MSTDLVRVISDSLYEHLEVRVGYEGPPRNEHDCCAVAVLDALKDAGIGYIDPKATRQARVYTDADQEAWVDRPCSRGCDCGECYSRSPDQGDSHHCELT